MPRTTALGVFIHETSSMKGGTSDPGKDASHILQVPGLYIARGCEYLWATVPFLGRDLKRVEDVDSRGPDHAADAVRYGCLREAQDIQFVELSGV